MLSLPRRSLPGNNLAGSEGGGVGMRRTSSSAGLSSHSSMLHRFHADHNEVSNMTSQDISRSQSTSHISRKFQQKFEKYLQKLKIPLKIVAISFVEAIMMKNIQIKLFSSNQNSFVINLVFA